MLLVLGGCGGGGGSGSAGGSPAGFSYPSSLATATSTNSVSGVVAPYALDPRTTQLNSIPLGLFAVGATTGKLIFTVSPIQLPSGAVEPGFVVTFDSASSSSLPVNLNSPLSSLSPICADCLKTDTALAGGGAGSVNFTYLGAANTTFPLKYSALGIWSRLRRSPGV